MRATNFKFKDNCTAERGLKGALTNFKKKRENEGLSLIHRDRHTQRKTDRLTDEEKDG